MTCPVCGHQNGDFTVRCHGCGHLLISPGSDQKEKRRAYWTPLTTLFAATTLLLAIVLLGLLFLIEQRGAWSPLINGADFAVGPPSLSPTLALVVTANATAAPPPRRTTLDLSQAGTSDIWRFAVDQVRYTSDDSAGGWRQAYVTFALQNAGSRVASLEIPSTVNPPAAKNARPADQTPSFVPAPSISDQSLTPRRGLRFYLVDAKQREYGGGFGSSNSSYQVIAAPGDTVRLTYSFRYPGDGANPSTLRARFPMTAGGRSFDVDLSRSATPSVPLVNAPSSADILAGEWAIVPGQWAIAIQGAEFGPSRGPGERPLTVHLDVENLSNQDRPALTDSEDVQGALRDFYLTDTEGHLAYSQLGDLPGLIVPAHGRRQVQVQLVTLDLPASARPLLFTLVLNWETNRYVRFRLD